MALYTTIDEITDHYYTNSCTQSITKAPILIFANKRECIWLKCANMILTGTFVSVPAEDVTGCMTPADISESLSLTTLRLQNWHIQGCSALTGSG